MAPPADSHPEAVVSVVQTTTKARNADYFESLDTSGKNSQRYKQRFETLKSHKDAVMQEHKEAVTGARMSVGQLREAARKRDGEWQALQRKHALEREHLHQGAKGEAEPGANNEDQSRRYQGATTNEEPDSEVIGHEHVMKI